MLSIRFRCDWNKFRLGIKFYFWPQSITDKIKNNDLFTKFYRFFDPLRGKPRCKSNGIRYYNSWTLSEYNSILEMKGLKQIDILEYYFLSIIVKLWPSNWKSINKGIRFNFLLFHHKSQFVIIQKQRGLKYQIIESLKLLNKIYSELNNNSKNNLSVKLYDE